MDYYASAVRRRALTLLTAVSAYTAQQQHRLEALGRYGRVMASPNITLGINFMLSELHAQAPGYYTFEGLLQAKLVDALTTQAAGHA